MHSCFSVVTFVQLYCYHFCHSKEKQERRDGVEDQFLWTTIETPHSKVKNGEKHLCCCCTHKCRLCLQQFHNLKYDLFHGHPKNPSKTHVFIAQLYFSCCLQLHMFVQVCFKSKNFWMEWHNV
jgi:hypothetical protein